MSDAPLISAEAIKTYYEKPYDDREILENGSVSRKKGDWVISSLIDGRFQGLVMPLIQKRKHPATVFPLEVHDMEMATAIAETFDNVQRRLADAKRDPSRTPTVDEVVRAYEDMYFMLTPMTDANRYLRDLVEEGMVALGLQRPTLPRQAFDGEALSEGQLAMYVAKEFTNYNMMEEGLELSTHPSQPIRNLVHDKCSSIARIFCLEDEFEFVTKQCPVTEGMTAVQAQRISRRFVNTQQAIESAIDKHRSPPSKGWIEEAFSDYHNMLQPTTILNRYQRTLIEKALDTMGLDDSLLDARSAAQFAEDERQIAAKKDEKQGRVV